MTIYEKGILVSVFRLKMKLRGETGRDKGIYGFQSMNKRKGRVPEEPKKKFQAL